MKYDWLQCGPQSRQRLCSLRSLHELPWFSGMSESRPHFEGALNFSCVVVGNRRKGVAPPSPQLVFSSAFAWKIGSRFVASALDPTSF